MIMGAAGSTVCYNLKLRHLVLDMPETATIQLNTSLYQVAQQMARKSSQMNLVMQRYRCFRMSNRRNFDFYALYGFQSLLFKLLRSLIRKLNLRKMLLRYYQLELCKIIYRSIRYYTSSD
ncbi:hypothetical protein C5167_034105 [Papaver somniferum]|uniref:Uncharacterized protein n=1 Tax=Papaver somniferum TaxID=3469 RepID=A0A4Y7KF21_PAPSO|nr:hypothetical protein C5167_034105 [Papaver somniferum]